MGRAKIPPSIPIYAIAESPRSHPHCSWSDCSGASWCPQFAIIGRIQHCVQMTGNPECMSWPGEMCSDEVDFGGNFVCQVVSRCAEILPLPIRLQLLKSALLGCCVTIRSEQQPQWRLR